MTLLQTGVGTATLQGAGLLSTFSAVVPHPSIVVTTLVGIAPTATITTVLTPPGTYDIVFQERALVGGAVLGTATLELTVLPLLGDPPPTTTTTTSTTATTTTSPTTSTTTSTTTTLPNSDPGPTTTTTDPPATAPEPTSTTTTTAAPPAPTTTTGEGGGPAVPAPTTTTMPPPTTATTSEELAGVGAPDDQTGLPPTPGTVVLAAEEPVRSFLDPFLPQIVNDVIMSPYYVLMSVLRGAFDSAWRIVAFVVVAAAYAAYLARRWKRPLDEGGSGL